METLKRYLKPFEERISQLEAENAALKGDLEQYRTTHIKHETTWSDVERKNLGEIFRLGKECARLVTENAALKAEIQVLFNAFPWNPTPDGTPALTAVENAIYQYEDLRDRLKRAEAEVKAENAAADEYCVENIKLFAKLERAEKERDEAIKLSHQYRNKLERAEEALRGMPHTCKSHSVRVCAGCMAKSYFEESK